jgi:hypothetical protein
VVEEVSRSDGTSPSGTGEEEPTPGPSTRGAWRAKEGKGILPGLLRRGRAEDANMDLGFIDAAIVAFKDVTLGIVNMIGKSRLDLTEKERLQTQVQLAGMDFQVKLAEFKSQIQLKWMELTALASWRSVIIYGSGILIGIMMLNNNVFMPYFPQLKPMPIPWELWSIFGGLIGVDVTITAVNHKKENKS